MATTETQQSTQFLTFRLENEVYAVDVAQVREVLEYTSVTRVPRMPVFMRGVINLRGSVVPVIDLRLKFGMSKTEQTIDTCIIVTEVDLDGESLVLGALADSVQEVIDLDLAQVEPPPRIGTRVRSEFIKGMGKRDDAFLIILDIDRVFSADELTDLTTNQSPAAEIAAVHDGDQGE